MAGIGFALRKLKMQDTLLGIIQCYSHSAIVTMGPWLLTILSIVTITLISPIFVSISDLENFRLIIIYNFAFSLVLSGPVLIVASRYIADLIYKKNMEEVPSLMLGSLIIMYCTQIIIILPYYIFYVDLDIKIRLAAIINFLLITGVWLASVFLSALKEYSQITFTFTIGTIISILLSILLAKDYQTTGMLCGYSIGLAFTMFSLIARILSEYPYRIVNPFKILTYFKRYRSLALSGFVYNCAIWIDKWIMWFAPERIKLSSGMISYPDYDSAMFLAYLFILPSMAIFIVEIETNFFENYLKFYNDIHNRGTYEQIKENIDTIIDNIFKNSRIILIFQGVVCLIVVILAPQLFKILNINYLQIGIFRLGVIGSTFHVLMLYLTIILSYFDLRKEVLLIYILFLLNNVLFTIITMNLGFTFYGYGYVLAALITFAITYLTTIYYLHRIPYLTFIQNNKSIKNIKTKLVTRSKEI